MRRPCEVGDAKFINMAVGVRGSVNLVPGTEAAAQRGGVG